MPHASSARRCSSTESGHAAGPGMGSSRHTREISSLARLCGSHGGPKWGIATLRGFQI